MSDSSTFESSGPPPKAEQSSPASPPDSSAAPAIQAARFTPQQLRLMVGAALAALFLAALDQTVASSIMPLVVAELGDMRYYAWTFSAFMVASTIAVPIVGKLGDLYGRRRLLLSAVFIFAVGSLGIGIAPTMWVLVLARAIQGFGSGAITASVSALIGDLFPPTERARMLGLVTAIFGLASLIGPIVGGLVADTFGWRFVFLMNLPLALALFFPLVRLLPAPPKRQDPISVDYAGAFFLSACLVSLLLALSSGAEGGSGMSSAKSLLLALAVLTGAIFVRVESSAREPIIPLDLFRNPVVWPAVMTSALLGAALYSASAFLPLFCETIYHWNATQAGLLFVPQTLALVVGSIIGGRRVHQKHRYQSLIVVGSLGVIIGTILLSRLTGDTPLALRIVSVAVLGFGLGLAMPTIAIAVQNAIPHRFVGVSSSITNLARTLGGSLGIAILGLVFSVVSARTVEQRVPALVSMETDPLAVRVRQQLLDPASLLNEDAFRQLQHTDQGNVLEKFGIRDAHVAAEIGSHALTRATQWVFLGGTLLSLLAFFCALRIPEIPLRQHNDPE